MPMRTCIEASLIRIARITGVAAALALWLQPPATATATSDKRWNDAELVEAYARLAPLDELERAIRNPALPADAPEPAFLEALAWLAAQTPDRAGTLTLAEADAFIDRQVALYTSMLRAKAAGGEDNDYARTRTWKVIQKLTLLRDAMARAPHDGRFAYGAMPRATSADDPWDQEHTLASNEAFAARVCNASDRPVVVKFGNTNCTQCMLFELMGSVKKYSDRSAERAALDVYKVWWGLRPDSSFAGRVENPARLDALAKAEGVQSSPAFIVYRAGRRYPCGSGFLDARGEAPWLDECIARSFGEAPLSSVCARGALAPAGRKGIGALP